MLQPAGTPQHLQVVLEWWLRQSHLVGHSCACVRMAECYLLQTAVMSHGYSFTRQLSMQDRSTGSVQWKHRGASWAHREGHSHIAAQRLMHSEPSKLSIYSNSRGANNHFATPAPTQANSASQPPGFQTPVCPSLKPIGEQASLVDQQMPSGPDAWQPFPRPPACFCDVSAWHTARCSIAAGSCRFIDALAPSADPACCQPASAQPYSLRPLLPLRPGCLTLGVTHCQQLALYNSGPSACSLQLPDWPGPTSSGSLHQDSTHYSSAASLASGAASRCFTPLLQVLTRPRHLRHELLPEDHPGAGSSPAGCRANPGRR